MLYVLFIFVFFFFKQKTAYEMRISDWSSDVCSSDLRRSRALTELTDADWQGVDDLIAQIRTEAAVLAELAASPELGRRKQLYADRKSTRLNSSHSCASRMPSSA